ncbi:hypothetical protein FA95DRAFT_865009 [Auriscalpium vulgare]|uniref:Uncharacterized protein n=1 Tax=Auriscalpium vulgare TaxID=40419 RepID=A0ACB8R8W7_9AGAM|nr:hypothetical protein FA95DRAFT_865009 [Auriscalpium vulgare]
MPLCMVWRYCMPCSHAPPGRLVQRARWLMPTLTMLTMLSSRTDSIISLLGPYHYTLLPSPFLLHPHRQSQSCLPAQAPLSRPLDPRPALRSHHFPTLCRTRIPRVYLAPPTPRKYSDPNASGTM